MSFKHELQTAKATARQWSRDVLRFAVCGLRSALAHEIPDAKVISLVSK